MKTKLAYVFYLILLSVIAQAQFITSIVATPSTTSATVAWTTCAASDSRVNYGTTASYGSSVYSATPVTSHSVNLTGLLGGVLYHYDVVSVDASGVQVQSADATFTTSGTSPSVTTNPSNVGVCSGVSTAQIGRASRRKRL